VRAIIVYPMNALVNSQYEALERLAKNYRQRTGQTLPVRFAKYTGQEEREERERILKVPPHILLTNYVMLELMLVRPHERPFVDKTVAGIEFLVFDELQLTADGRVQMWLYSLDACVSVAVTRRLFVLGPVPQW